MSVERLCDGSSIAGLALLDQRCRADDDPGDAKAALNAALEDERIAHPLADVLRQPFESHDVATLCLLGLAQTGERGRAVDHDEAAAACPFWRAPVFRGDDAALFPQHLEQVHARLVRGDGLFPVQSESDLSRLDRLIWRHMRQVFPGQPAHPRGARAEDAVRARPSLARGIVDFVTGQIVTSPAAPNSKLPGRQVPKGGWGQSGSW